MAGFFYFQSRVVKSPCQLLTNNLVDQCGARTGGHRPSGGSISDLLTMIKKAIKIRLEEDNEKDLAGNTRVWSTLSCEVDQPFLLQDGVLKVTFLTSQPASQSEGTRVRVCLIQYLLQHKTATLSPLLFSIWSSPSTTSAISRSTPRPKPLSNTCKQNREWEMPKVIKLNPAVIVRMKIPNLKVIK